MYSNSENRLFNVGLATGVMSLGFLKISCNTGMNKTNDNKLNTTKSKLHKTTRKASPLYLNV